MTNGGSAAGFPALPRALAWAFTLFGLVLLTLAFMLMVFAPSALAQTEQPTVQATAEPTPAPEPEPTGPQEVRLSDGQLEVFTKGIALLLFLGSANLAAQLWR